LPLDASDFSCPIAEKSRVNEAAEIDGALAEVLGLDEPELPEFELLPQAATTRPAATASETIRFFLITRLK